MAVEIDPPLIGQPFGLGESDVRRLILATRHCGHTLFPVDEWPAYVYVARILDEAAIRTGVFRCEDVQMIAWGMLFQNYEEAEREAVQHNEPLL